MFSAQPKQPAFGPNSEDRFYASVFTSLLKGPQHPFKTVDQWDQFQRSQQMLSNLSGLLL